MPIVIKCNDCGKAMKAPDKYAGKAVKCPSCGSALRVPGGESPAAADGEGQATPAAPTPPGQAAGYVSPFGPKPRPEPAEESAGQQAPKALMLMIGAGVTISIAVLVLLVWFGGKAIFSVASYERSFEYFRTGELDEAVNELREAVANSGGDGKRAAEQMLAIVENEQKNNLPDVLAEGLAVLSPDVEITTKEPMRIKRRFLIPFRFTNTSSQAVTLRDKYFYLRGGRDITYFFDKDGTTPIDGVVVQPGEEYQGELPFFRHPTVPANSLYFLIFNDGQIYDKKVIKY